MATVWGGCTVLCLGNALAQTATPAVHLLPVQQVRAGVDAWPLIASPSTLPELRMNTVLTRLNTRLFSAVVQCDAGYRAWLKQMDPETQRQKQVADAWKRTVTVTMLGPQYMSLLASDVTVCAGGHPRDDGMAVVFDLSTGALVDWLALLPKSPGTSALAGTILDGSPAGAIVFPALRTMYVAAAQPACKDKVEDVKASFQLGLDAKQGALIAIPYDPLHTSRTCADPLYLLPEQAAQLGFSEPLLAAVAAAHAGSQPQP